MKRESPLLKCYYLQMISKPTLIESIQKVRDGGKCYCEQSDRSRSNVPETTFRISCHSFNCLYGKNTIDPYLLEGACHNRTLI